MNCITCGKELTGLQRKYCSISCKMKNANTKFQCYQAQQQRGIDRKLKFVNSLGGKCCICGYDKSLSALEFHHINPLEKSIQLDLRHLSNNSLSVLENELKKCILLCSNCHREIHHPVKLNPKATLANEKEFI
jgi:5-methylcytosine-specific restriction endonuclease McrA